MTQRQVNLTELRERAEQAIAHGEERLRASLGTPVELEFHRLVEELRIYQAELEIQNEDLSQAQGKTALALERYRLLFEHLPLPALLIDQTGFIREANLVACDLLGLSRHRALQRGSLFQRFDFSSRAVLHQLLQPRREPSPVVGQLLGVRLGTDQILPCDVHLTPLQEQSVSGGQTLVVLVDRSADLAVRESEQRLRDLSADLERQVEARTAELRAANTTLKVSEARYRAAFENSLDAIVISRLDDGTYLDVNRGFLDGLGYKRHEVIGRSALELGIWVDPTARQYVVDAMRANRPLLNYETCFRTRNGETLWCLMSASQVEFDGTPCMLSVTRDITERKRDEEALRQARDTAEVANRALQEANAELQRLATTDPLTGIWNRRRFVKVAEMEIVRTRRYHVPVSLVLFDIDHFKSINDRHGHQVGDRVLIELTRLIHDHLRAVDVLARWGGEEFVLLLPHCGAVEAVTVAEKLRVLMECHPFPTIGRATASFGVAQLRPQETLDDWLKRADDALYAAKALGRNRVSTDTEEAPGTPAAGLNLVWRSSFACGVASIDDDHRELFRLTNTLIDLGLADSSPAAFLSALDALLSQLVAHFAREEAVLADHGYTQTEDHAAVHRELAERAMTLRREAEAGTLGFGELVEFLAKEVVVHHMLHDDRDYFGLFGQTETC